MFVGFRVEKEWCDPETVVFRVHGQQIPETVPPQVMDSQRAEFCVENHGQRQSRSALQKLRVFEFMTSKNPKRSLQQVMNVNVECITSRSVDNREFLILRANSKQ
jgi:hypothetical protein